MLECSMCSALSLLCIFFSLMYFISVIGRIKERQKYKQMIYDYETQMYNLGAELSVNK